MRTRLAIIVGAIIFTSISAQAVVTLPENLQAERAAAEQAQAALKQAFTQRAIDTQAGNVAAVAADEAQIQVARDQFRTAMRVFLTDAAPLLKPDRDAVRAAVSQLHIDEAAGNPAAVAADKVTLASAKAQLKQDQQAVFGNLRLPRFGWMHRKHHE